MPRLIGSIGAQIEAIAEQVAAIAVQVIALPGRIDDLEDRLDFVSSLAISNGEDITRLETDLGSVRGTMDRIEALFPLPDQMVLHQEVRAAWLAAEREDRLLTNEELRAIFWRHFSGLEEWEDWLYVMLQEDPLPSDVMGYLFYVLSPSP